MKKKEGFIRVSTTLYKIVNQPRIGGGYVKRGTLTGFWKQKNHSSIGRFLMHYAVTLKTPYRANEVTPL